MKSADSRLDRIQNRSIPADQLGLLAKCDLFEMDAQKSGAESAPLCIHISR
jgi:hypothetical protein